MAGETTSQGGATGAGTGGTAGSTAGATTQGDAGKQAGGTQGAGKEGAGGATGSNTVVTQAQQQAGQDGKTGDTAGATGASAEISIKVPEGFEANKEQLGKFTSWAKESGLKGEQAQKVFDLYVDAQKQQLDGLLERQKQQEKAWLDGLSTDKELGGQNLDATKASIAKARTKFGSKELDAFLDSSRLGNHPEVVRFFARVGKALGEDKAAATGNGANAPQTGSDKDFLRTMYPSMHKES